MFSAPQKEILTQGAHCHAVQQETAAAPRVEWREELAIVLWKLPSWEREGSLENPWTNRVKNRAVLISQVILIVQFNLNEIYSSSFEIFLATYKDGLPLFTSKMYFSFAFSLKLCSYPSINQSHLCLAIFQAQTRWTSSVFLLANLKWMNCSSPVLCLIDHNLYFCGDKVSVI